MRSAKEIMKQFDFTTSDDYNPVFERMKRALNEARKECIIECANVAKASVEIYENEDKQDCFAEVDKESILSLINKLE